jgi:hypothetical protein
MKMKKLVVSTFFILIAPTLALAQVQPSPQQPPTSMPQLDDIAISPSRIELPMMPGTEKTVVINLIYSSETGNGPLTRVVAYLGDWSITREGKVEFFPAGSRPNSASSWLVYSPTEVSVEPRKTHSIRVTVSVPKDATPGDHLAALFVEPRPDNNKSELSRRQLRMKFRLGAMFYIMVPNLTQNASLENLKVNAMENGLVVIPRLKNEGNTHVRPVYSLKVLDQTGGTIADVPETESLPVLAGSELEMPLFIERVLPTGVHSVRYRVKFSETGALTEGRAEVIVKGRLAKDSLPAEPSPTQTPKLSKAVNK